MTRILLLALLVFSTACDAKVHSVTTSDYDPAALMQANYWAGLFWIALPICAAIVLVAWAVAYGISERAKYGPREDRS